MPELPDVETFRRYMDATALHQRIVQVRVRNARVLIDISSRRLKRGLKGTAFETTDRHGKYLFAQVGPERWLVLHFGIPGFLEYEKQREPTEHDRVIFDFANGYSLAYLCQRLLGKVMLAESPTRFAQDNELGPDALQIGWGDFRSVLQESRATVKSCLMEQKHIAGIGNIYSDEILFHSRVSPKGKSNRLSETQTKRLYRQMQRVLNVAVSRKADPGRMPLSWLLPHRAEGGPCPRCRGEIEKTKVAGRSAYWCPNCQKT